MVLPLGEEVLRILYDFLLELLWILIVLDFDVRLGLIEFFDVSKPRA